MMSNWNYNTKMTTSTVGMCPIYTIGRPPSKPIFACDNYVTKNGISGRNFSFGFVGNILQKMTNMIIPNVAHINTLERSKLSLSTPDIFVDLSINTPIFEAVHGKAKLTIPENEPSCDQTKSLSAGNSPLDWCSKTDDATLILNSNRERLGKHRKTKTVFNHVTPIMGKDEIIIKKSMYKQCNSYPKTKMSNKKRKKRKRSNLLIDIREDYQQISDDNDQGSDNEKKIQLNMDDETNCKLSYSPRDMNGVLDLTEKSFPTICSSIVKCDRPSDGESDTDSENSFVIFSDNVQVTTPSAMIPRRRDLCTTINKFFGSPLLAERQRHREISEGSDDSIVFCYESDNQESIFESEKDLDSDGDIAEDQNSSLDDSENTTSHQPDSGFEERKVQFNLKPEVHVMRTWDFAYRQARKGEWEMAARDRERFKKRIHETEAVLSKVFDANVRDKMYQERFNC